jgi:hypothetical protein
MKITSLLCFYGGPGQLMPLTSGLTAMFAFLLIFWNKTLGLVARVLDFFRPSRVVSSSNQQESMEVTQQSDGQPQT